MSTTNENKQLAKEEVIRRNNLYININMTGCKDRVMTYLLFTIEHLENVNNTKVSHQFLAKQVNASVETVKRKLKKLKELQLVNWVSGKDKKEANTYTINHQVYNELKYKLNSFKTMIDRLEFINNFFKQKPTASLMFKKSKEIDNGVDTDDNVINNDTEGYVDSRNLVQVNLMKQMVQQPLPTKELIQVGQLDPSENTIVLGTEQEIESKIESFKTLTDDDVRQLFKDNGDEWLLDKWLSSDKTQEEVKLLIDTKVEIYNKEDNEVEPSIFDDDYLQKMYPNRNLIKTEYGTYVDAEEVEQLIEHIYEEETY